MAIPEDRGYNPEHTWAKVQGNRAYVGITEFAQEQLGDIIFVDLPKVGELVTKDTSFGTVESAKTVSDLIAPLSGTIVEVNAKLDDEPEMVNQSPYDQGSMILIELTDPAEQDALLSAQDYGQVVADA